MFIPMQLSTWYTILQSGRHVTTVESSRDDNTEPAVMHNDLSKHEVELRICLVHLITFQQTEIGTTQQVILTKTSHVHTQINRYKNNTTIHTVSGKCKRPFTAT